MCGRLRHTYWRKRSPACSIPSALSQLSSDPDGVTRARQPMDQYLRLRTKGPGQSIWSIQQRSYVPNFHGDTGSTFTARSAVSDSRSFSSRRKESYSAILSSGLLWPNPPHRATANVAATILSVSVMLSLVTMSLRGADDHSRSPTEERADTQPCSMNAPDHSIRPSLWQRIRQPLPK